MTLLGMLLGMGLLHFAAGTQTLLWAAFCALTVLHVWANVRAMRCLRITSLNQARLGLLLRHYLCQVCIWERQAAGAGREKQQVLRQWGAAARCSAAKQLAPRPHKQSCTRQQATACCQDPSAGGCPDSRPSGSAGELGAAAAAAPAACAEVGRGWHAGCEHGASAGKLGECLCWLLAGRAMLAG